MENEDTWACPCCSATLGVDDSGELVALVEPDLPAGSYRAGRGKLVVVDSNPAWRAGEYLHNQQSSASSSKLTALTSAPRLEPELAPFEDDLDLRSAVSSDLKNRGIATTNTND